MKSLSLSILALACCFALPSAALGQIPAFLPEFQVNTAAPDYITFKTSRWDTTASSSWSGPKNS